MNDYQETQAAFQEARRFREFLPDRNKDKDWDELAKLRRAKREKKLWPAWRALLTRVWA